MDQHLSQCILSSKKAIAISIHTFSLSFLSLLIFGCQKDYSDFEVIQTESTYDVLAIEYFNNQIIATAGSPWEGSDLITSFNLSDWQTKYLTNRGMFDIQVRNQLLRFVGNSGFILEGREEYQKIDFDRTDMLRACTNIGDNFIAAGGKDFNKGWAFTLNVDNELTAESYFDAELSDIVCHGSGICIISGYGLILISNDAGQSWQRSTQSGDFYKGIANNQYGDTYVVGYSGSILRSVDDGKTWINLKDGHSPLKINRPFRKIKFYNAQGFIVGDNGTILRSEDDGLSWSDISIDEDIDLFDLVLLDNQLVIGGESGKIIIVKLR